VPISCANQKNSLLAPFWNFAGIFFFFFDFNGYHNHSKEFSFIRSHFLNFTGLFFRHFANRAVKSRIFEWKSTRKGFFAAVSREGIGGDVAEVAEEIIRETCKELDIEIITNFLEGSIKKKSKSI